MYKLYGYIPKLSLILTTFDEEKVIEKINEYIYKVDYIHFMVIQQLSDRMIPWRSICSEEEFLEYIDDYRKENEITRKRTLK